MKKHFLISTILILFASCGNSHKPLEKEVAISTAPLTTINSIVAKITFPQPNQMEYDGELIADLSALSPVISSAGSVSKGLTLNYITIEGLQFLVYGEDGVFATECEPSAFYPDHGSTHPKCETTHAESFDKIILCTSAAANTDLATAQNWPGSEEAMENPSLGMICWVNGVKMLSSKIFTY